MKRPYIPCLIVLIGSIWLNTCEYSTYRPEEDTSCGAGTVNVDGECQTVVTCDAGYTNVDNTCVPRSGTNCEDGTVEGPDGLCVPAEDSPCNPNPCTEPHRGQCVASGGEPICSCDSGYTYDLDGNCVAVDVCGNGICETSNSEDETSCPDDCAECNPEELPDRYPTVEVTEVDGVTTYSDTALEDSLVLSNYVDIASGNMRQADYGDLSASCPVAPPNQFICMSYDIVLNTFCEDLAEAYPSS